MIAFWFYKQKNLIKVMIKYFQNMDFVSHIPKISANEKLG